LAVVFQEGNGPSRPFEDFAPNPFPFNRLAEQAGGMVGMGLPESGLSTGVVLRPWEGPEAARGWGIRRESQRSEESAFGD